MQLLETQMVLLDQAGATSTARKLSGLRDWTKPPGLLHGSVVGVGRKATWHFSAHVTVLWKLNRMKWPDGADQPELPYRLGLGSQHEALPVRYHKPVQDEVPAKFVWNVRAEKQMSKGKLSPCRLAWSACSGDRPTNLHAY